MDRQNRKRPAGRRICFALRFWIALRFLIVNGFADDFFQRGDAAVDFFHSRHAQRPHARLQSHVAELLGRGPAVDLFAEAVVDAASIRTARCALEARVVAGGAASAVIEVFVQHVLGRKVELGEDVRARGRSTRGIPCRFFAPATPPAPPRASP